MSGVGGTLYKHYKFNSVIVVIGERSPRWLTLAVMANGELDPRVMWIPKGIRDGEVVLFFKRHGNKDLVRVGDVWYDRELLSRANAVIDREMYQPLRSDSFVPFEYWEKGIMVTDSRTTADMVAALRACGKEGKVVRLNGTEIK